MKVRVKIGEDVGDLKAKVDAPSTKDKVSLLEARTKYIAEMVKNWIVLLAGTSFALVYMGAAIIGLIDGTFNELEIVWDKTWSAVMLLIGFAAGQATSKGNGNDKKDQ